jgi:hypothetical protein
MDASMHLRGRVEVNVQRFKATDERGEFVELTVRDGPYPMGVIHLFFQDSKQQLLDFANDLREAALSLYGEEDGLANKISNIIQPIAQSYTLGERAVDDIMEILK